MPTTEAPPGAAVVVRGLRKTYGGTDVVDGLDLQATAAAVTAVLGPNGAGKTTTVECCEGLRSPDDGSVRVLGLDPVHDATRLRPRVGVMLQDGGLPTGVRAMEMLRHVAAMYAAPRDLDELSERLGLTSFGRTTVRRLSGGQRQRLALAAAVVGRPEVVFLDEPSAGMDPQSRHAVWDLIRELRDDGTAVVLTTHLMDEAEDLADVVHVVDHGRLVTSGTVPQLLAARSGTAAPTVRMDARPGLDTAALAAHLGTVLPDGGWTVEESDPGTYTITGATGPDAVAALTDWLARQDVLARRIAAGRRTLEDVFLDLTGRHLR